MSNKLGLANHVLVMPSRAQGLPSAIVEAMLCGRPVIATSVGGHPEIFEDGTKGFLAKAPTVDFFRAALKRAWERRDGPQTMGLAAARRIRDVVPPDPVSVFAERLKALMSADGGYAI